MISWCLQHIMALVINVNINPYKYKKLTDYYISSSHRSFLVGFQKGDYCSLNMINRVIYLGARYIELEIFNKETIEKKE